MLDQLGWLLLGTLQPNLATPAAPRDDCSVLSEKSTQIATPGPNCKEAESATSEMMLCNTSLGSEFQI